MCDLNIYNIRDKTIEKYSVKSKPIKSFKELEKTIAGCHGLDPLWVKIILGPISDHYKGDEVVDWCWSYCETKSVTVSKLGESIHLSMKIPVRGWDFDGDDEMTVVGKLIPKYWDMTGIRATNLYYPPRTGLHNEYEWCYVKK